MTTTLERRYEERDIIAILEASEDRALGQGPNAPGGHSKIFHELIETTIGGPKHARLRSLRARLLPQPGKKKVSASSSFRNCQARAVAFALNTRGGQEALRLLSRPDCLAVVAHLNITAGGFPMLGYRAKDGTKNDEGTDFLPDPGDVLAFWRPKTGMAGGLTIKLMKTPAGELHIQTAVPTESPPPTPHAQVSWAGGGGIGVQNLPV
ncbi:hypothetical protein LPC08_13675 [Roseomonas sp. OT10]|uniref:hypothetical protein n=1 Tax=Roseomonas cutis TaxID=2897332 RepID=UPI001E3FFE6F|nr:hypothetical protein [Roseomonas sp. OT10]UFN47077.1 hypothetical protein LPC08_13675 [Roseomonas sp. OT10]